MKAMHQPQIFYKYGQKNTYINVEKAKRVKEEAENDICRNCKERHEL